MKPRSGWWSFRTRRPEPAMSLPRTVADVIASHVTLELESLDRVYLNVYQPRLQTPRALFHFLREHYGEGAVSSHQMKAITEQFLENIEDYVLEHEIPVTSFEKGQRKVTGPRRVGDQRASALRFGDPKVQALLGVLVLFRLLPCGFRSRDLREHIAPLLGDVSRGQEGSHFRGPKRASYRAAESRSFVGDWRQLDFPSDDN